MKKKRKLSTTNTRESMKERKEYSENTSEIPLEENDRR
jgi:hypothetical protein